jgi:predicted ATPase/class 3 adenylate cyclase
LADLPTGTVTFLFTDLEGSSRLWDEHPEAMRLALARHDSVLRDAVVVHSGYVVKTTGDGLHAVFASAHDALAAAAGMQVALASESLEEAALSIRIGIHSGEAEFRDGDYFGTVVNRAARITATARGGQILCSGATAELVGDQSIAPLRLLDLGVHRLRGLSRPEHFWQVVGPGLREQFPPLATGENVRGNLPTFLDDFIGRDESIHDVVELLAEARLVTLVGVGGVGKTRLAVHAAATMADRFRDGTWFVELGPIGDPTLVSSEIASVLGVAEKPGRALLDGLVDALSDRHALLIIDNCEHLLDSAAHVVEALLAQVATLRVLATSREGLMIRGERLWPVPSVAPEDAVALFASRASAVRPQFSTTSANRDAVATICARLDGIPLAIELAASRVASMTPEDIAAHLDERFRLLTGGNRTALERHQTLRRTVDWSYELLHSREQQLFRRFSVFAGSCTLEAIAAVATDDSVDEVGVADLLAGLVARSLVVVDESGPTARYRMLETLRAFGLELLDADRETDVWRARHADYYAALAERIDPGLKGPDELQWVARLEVEQDDLRSALRWALDSDRIELALRIVASLAWPWWTQGAIAEGDRAVSAALDIAESRRPDLQARIVADWALFAQQDVDWDTCAARCRRAIELAERFQLPLARPYALLGMLAAFHGRVESALALGERARSIAARQGDEWEWGYAMSCSVHSCTALGDYDTATELASVLLPRARSLGNPTRIADALLSHALAIAPSDPRAACLELAESADLFETVGNLPLGGAMVSNGVQLALSIDDVPLAASFVRRRIASVQNARNYSFDQFLPLFALHVAAVLHAGGSLTDAAVMLGASDALMMRSSAMYILPGARVLSEPELREALLTDEFDEARARGRALDRDEVLAQAEASLAAFVDGSASYSL